MIAFAATLIPASTVGCSSDSDTSSVTDAGDDVSLDAAVYGAPIDSSPPDTTAKDTAVVDSGEPLDMGSAGDVYGAPFDSGTD